MPYFQHLYQMPDFQDCWQDTGKRLWHSQQVMPFMSWECPATSAYWGLIRNLYEMTLAGQDLATHLFAPFLWPTFISPLYRQNSLYCASDTWVELGRSHWSSPRSKVLSLKCIIRLAQGACSVRDGMSTPPVWLRIEWYLTYTHSNAGGRDAVWRLP